MEYPPILGGGASYTKNLINQLIKLKTEIVLVTNGLSDSVEKINDFFTIKRYKVFHDMYYGNIGLLRGVDVLLQEIRNEAPDILHTVYIEETLIGQIANLNYGIPHIVTHTKTPMYREESIEKNSTWSLFDYVNRSNLITYITPGLAYRDSLLQTGVKSENIHLIYPGIDQEIFKKIDDAQILGEMRSRLKIVESDSVILIPCMLRKRKGLNFVAEALSKLTLANHKIKVIITGTPKNEEELLIYEDFKKHKGNAEIIDHDRFSNEDMPVLYNIANVTVLCSEAEGYGTVFLEAMACECPVIGSDVIGINESIRNGYNGILCEYGDTTALNSAITKMLTDKKAKEEYVRNSLLVLESTRNLRKQAESHLKLYKKCRRPIQEVASVLYRETNLEEEVYLLQTNGSHFYLPKILKVLNESWLQAAIKNARADSGYQVLIPKHLIIDENNINQVAYSFKLTPKTQHFDPLDKKMVSGLWTDLDSAILKVNQASDRDMLIKLKNYLNAERNLVSN